MREMTCRVRVRPGRCDRGTAANREIDGRVPGRSRLEAKEPMTLGSFEQVSVMQTPVALRSHIDSVGPAVRSHIKAFDQATRPALGQLSDDCNQDVWSNLHALRSPDERNPAPCQSRRQRALLPSPACINRVLEAAS